jgi:hypothetical protein
VTVRACSKLRGRRRREALGLRGAMVALHKRILLGMVRLTDLDLDAQTRAKTEQGRRKITACWTAHPARIAIQGDQLGPTILGQAQRQGEASLFLP